jgi:phage tail-like protein
MPRLVDSKSRIQTDPVRNFKFMVHIRKSNIANFARLGFMNMSGLSAATATIPYREGGNNTTQRKMPGQTDFGDVTLSRGVTLGSNQPWRWMLEIFSANQGEGTAGPTNNFRTLVDLLVLAHPVTSNTNTPAHVKYRLYNAWISTLNYSELDAGGNAVYVEQMTLVHEGFKRFLSTGPGTSVENST